MSLAQIPVFAAMAFLCVITWNDIRDLRIRNDSVVVLLVLYAFHTALLKFEGLPGDLMAGFLLFAIGLGMWLARAMGAGDVKLMFVIGLFTGYFALPIFGILLLLISVLLYLVIWICDRIGMHSGIGGRLARMKQHGKVPYALPLTLAALPSMLLGLYGPS